MKKKTHNLFLIIANIAVIGFVLAACDDPDSGTTGTTAISFTVNANGSASQTSTQLTFAFNKAVAGLTSADIGLSHSVNGQTVTKGTLSGSGTEYVLPISGFTAGGTLTVSITKSGYTFTGNPPTATIFYTASVTNLGSQTIAITAPATGETPQGTIAAGTGYTGAIIWYNGVTLHTESFAVSTIYRAQVTLTSATGYQWTSSPPNITVPNQTVTNRTVNGTGTGNTLTFSVTFPQTQVINYSVSISQGITDGEITATPDHAPAGTNITLTVTPYTGFRLKANSLTVTHAQGFGTIAIDSTNASAGIYHFKMPDSNVTVFAEFETLPANSISVVFDRFHDEDIDLSQSADVITLGTSQTIIVTVNGDYDNYLWYINGERKSGYENYFEEDGWYFNKVGLHTITAVVTTHDGKAYSKTVTFRVVM